MVKAELVVCKKSQCHAHRLGRGYRWGFKLFIISQSRIIRYRTLSKNMHRSVNQTNRLTGSDWRQSETEPNNRQGSNDQANSLDKARHKIGKQETN